VGSAAQSEAMKKVASRLRLELAQYHELSAFLQFGTDLDKASRAQITRGQRVVEILKQPEFNPMPLEKQVMILFAVNHGFLDDIPVEKLSDFEAGFHQFMEKSHPEIGKTVAQKRELSGETESSLSAAILEYKELIKGIVKEHNAEQTTQNEEVS
jgi:F-type H+-transporting ATPase subunit alpha